MAEGKRSPYREMHCLELLDMNFPFDILAGQVDGVLSAITSPMTPVKRRNDLTVWDIVTQIHGKEGAS
jgi:hypothetical protein